MVPAQGRCSISPPDSQKNPDFSRFLRRIFCSYSQHVKFHHGGVWSSIDEKSFIDTPAPKTSNFCSLRPHSRPVFQRLCSLNIHQVPNGWAAPELPTLEHSLHPGLETRPLTSDLWHLPRIHPRFWEQSQLFWGVVCFSHFFLSPASPTGCCVIHLL